MRQEKCPRCYDGLVYKVYDNLTDRVVEVTKQEWQTAPEQETAEAKGLRYWRMDPDTCPECGGEGIVFDDDYDDGPDPDLWYDLRREEQWRISCGQ